MSLVAHTQLTTQTQPADAKHHTDTATQSDHVPADSHSNTDTALQAVVVQGPGVASRKTSADQLCRLTNHHTYAHMHTCTRDTKSDVNEQQDTLYEGGRSAVRGRDVRLRTHVSPAQGRLSAGQQPTEEAHRIEKCASKHSHVCCMLPSEMCVGNHRRTRQSPAKCKACSQTLAGIQTAVQQPRKTDGRKWDSTD